jgi:excinuclease ABC subunit C
VASVSLGRAASGALPASPGVYRFRDAGGQALYLGRAARLRSRVGSYWGDLGDRQHLTPMMARVAAVEAVVCDSEHEAAWLERNLLEHELLPYNRTAGGQEVAVCIAIASSPRAPGLSVVHADGLPADGDSARSGVRYFGPYLGGARVRLAASGLLRTYPLGYAGDGQAGTVAEMARRRGVGPSDRAALLRSLRAVLDRDPVAVADVRAQLTRRRDVAAAAERYELAERIKAELAALDWVVCPQRAAVLDRVNATVAGWADGMLVMFEVVDGSLRGWQQLPATQAQAQHWLAVTPPRWRDFAERNATLAARLTGMTHACSVPVGPALTPRSGDDPAQRR